MKHLLQNGEEIQNIILGRIIQPTQQYFYNKRTKLINITAHHHKMLQLINKSCNQNAQQESAQSDAHLQRDFG